MGGYLDPKANYLGCLADYLVSRGETFPANHQVSPRFGTPLRWRSAWFQVLPRRSASIPVELAGPLVEPLGLAGRRSGLPCPDGETLLARELRERTPVNQNWIRIGSLLGLLGVGLGAFGAHALKEVLTPEKLEWWATGVQYQLVHALAVVLTGVLARENRRLHWAAGCFTAGVLIFSGTLYAMALGGPRVLGAITPLGGLAFLAGWGLLALLSTKGSD